MSFIKNNFIIFACVIAVACFFLFHGKKKENLEHITKASKQELAVSTIPKVTLKEWLNFADKQLSSKIKKYENSIQINEHRIGADDKIVFVPYNYPYLLSCDELFGISIIINSDGDDSNEVFLTGTFSHENNPTMPFVENSVAAKRLKKILCVHIANKLANIFDKSVKTPENYSYDKFFDNINLSKEELITLSEHYNIKVNDTHE